MSRQLFFSLAIVVLLIAMGLLMIFNTSSAEVLDRLSNKSTHAALYKQIVYAFCGAFSAILVWKVGHRNLVRYSGVLLVCTTVALLLLFVPGIGQKINGARRWLSIGPLSFQPSECAKYLIPLYYIRVIIQKQSLNFVSFLKLITTLAIPLGLILIEPDNGTTALILVTLCVLFLLTRVSFLYWGLPLLLLVGGGTALALRMPHVSHRIEVYLNPELDLLGKGHQPYQAKIAAGSGGLFGRGLAGSLQKLDYLPEAGNDYIAAIFAEEFGFFGIMILIGLYGALGAIGFHIGTKAATLEGFYVATIIAFLILLQAFLNLGVVSGLLPSKGMNLPFFSQGGTSLVVNLMAVALMLQVFKKSAEKSCEPRP